MFNICICILNTYIYSTIRCCACVAGVSMPNPVSSTLNPSGSSHNISSPTHWSADYVLAFYPHFVYVGNSRLLCAWECDIACGTCRYIATVNHSAYLDREYAHASFNCIQHSYSATNPSFKVHRASQPISKDHLSTVRARRTRTLNEDSYIIISGPLLGFKTKANTEWLGYTINREGILGRGVRNENVLGLRSVRCG